MYNEIISENFSNPTHNGEIKHSSKFLENKDPVCGDQVQITLKINNGGVELARFKAWGCATSIATANIFCKWIEGQDIIDINNTSSNELSDLLGNLNPEQYHCIEILQNLKNQFQEK